ncbi:hypothetical protein BE17_38965 [Sorangium cellulosum]|uniref:Uncharacterized protein n=1 Tax=Sorangium cellulosum TaxID=56 RepID=A0A150SGV2_SORCE|nr:hypothetical protein BE17_38965 [Sorangium cellulosum]
MRLGDPEQAEDRGEGGARQAWGAPTASDDAAGRRRAGQDLECGSVNGIPDRSAGGVPGGMKA